MTRRKVIVTVVALGVGWLHFVTGPEYRGPSPVFVNGYLIDLLLPAVLYLLVGVAGGPLGRRRVVRGLLVFAVGAAVETLQLFHIPLFGDTFDPLDYLMYAGGVGLGMIFEQTVLARLPAEA